MSDAEAEAARQAAAEVAASNRLLSFFPKRKKAREEPVRSRDGTFCKNSDSPPGPSRTPLDPSIQRYERGYLHGRLHPFYKSEDIDTLKASMLPCMHLAVNSADSKPSIAFNPHSPDLVAALSALLDFIGSMLTDHALQYGSRAGGSASASSLSGSLAFERPLVLRTASEVQGSHGLTDLCMCIDSSKVAMAKHIYLEDGNHRYIKVCIAKIPKNTPDSDGMVISYAHRLVLWCIYGGPPNDITDPVVMHTWVVASTLPPVFYIQPSPFIFPLLPTRCHQSFCLNPLHLLWGERARNACQRMADEEARNRERQQRG